MLKILLFFCFISYSVALNSLKCGTLKNLAPFSIENGTKIDGISLEYWEIIEKDLNIKTKCKIYSSWKDLLDAFEENKIDLVLVSSKNYKIKNAIFSNPYDKFPIVIATKDNIAFVPDIRVLKNNKIGVIKDSISFNIIKNKYPNLDFVVFNNIEEALYSLEEGNVKAILELLPIVIYGIHENNFLSIRISGKTGYYADISFMLNKKYKSLVSKINNELNNITVDKRLQVYDKWLKLNNFWTWEKIEIMLSVGIITLIALFVLTFILIRDIKRRDILEKELIKSKEKAEIATKAKSEFLANMSHEIRTPLNVIFGFITILKDLEIDKEKYNYLKIMENSVENLKNIINDILDFSKIEAGKFKINKVEFDLKSEIDGIYSLFSSKAKEKGIKLHLDIKHLDHKLITDVTRVKQVIANLLSNAIKFTKPSKNVVLKIDYDKNDKLLYIEVQDEGIGIEKNKINSIFDAFNQVDNSTTRKYGGTGLGLSISSKLVDMLGGELKVESEVGKGSKFYFIIPVKEGEKINKSKVDSKIENKKLNEKYDYYILLVEDNKANQMFMKVILNKLNIKFDIANNGKEAIELVKKNKYDLILMDENMPIMNGIEATKQIRKYEKDNNLENVIISALTANALEGDKERFISAGMDYYLSKPINIDKFKEILNNLKISK